MKKENNILKTETKRQNNYLYIFFIFLALGLLFIALGIYENRKLINSYSYLNNVIVDKNNEEGVNAYLDITYVPYSFAKYDDDDNYAFYIAYDDTYYYIVYLSDSLYNELSEIENFDTITLYGSTITIPDNVKEIAIEVYNERVDEDDQISLSEFNRYFGGVYLDNVSLNKQNYAFYIISIIPFLISLTFLGVFIKQKYQFQKTLTILKDKDREKLLKEINNKNSLYYDKYHLILTKNFIVSLAKQLIIIQYKDIIWIYEERIKKYGITISKNIKVMTKDGDKKIILTTDNLDKKATSTIKEIITNISSKNDLVLVGKNKNNEETVKEILKNS